MSWRCAATLRRAKRRSCPHPDGFKHANELVEFVKSRPPAVRNRLRGLSRKAPRSGFARRRHRQPQTQNRRGRGLRHNADVFRKLAFLQLRGQVPRGGHRQAVIAGILPALSLKQVMNFKSMCSTQIPDALVERLRAAPEDGGAQVGLDWAKEQIAELKERKVAGIHLYILNRAESADKAFAHHTRKIADSAFFRSGVP